MPDKFAFFAVKKAQPIEYDEQKLFRQATF